MRSCSYCVAFVAVSEICNYSGRLMGPERIMFYVNSEYVSSSTVMLAFSSSFSGRRRFLGIVNDWGENDDVSQIHVCRLPYYNCENDVH